MIISTAAAVARLFLQTKQPLLDWGEGMAESKEGGAIGTCPVVTLVNRDTSGAAEALAAVLREAGRGLVLWQLPDSREGGCVEGIFTGKWGPLANHDPRDTPGGWFPNAGDWGGS